MNKRNVDRFTSDYYLDDLQAQMFWRGRQIVKNPMDAWNMIEILEETKPDLIIETGTYHGGAALFYAEISRLLYDGGAYVVSIDIAKGVGYPETVGLDFWQGRSSVDAEVVNAAKATASDHSRVMVILDSDHSKDHVLAELRAYAPLVSKGCYLIVEDTNPLAFDLIEQARPLRGKGPGEALKAWQPTNHGFERDRSRERFGLTFHPGGYLKRVR